jgi:hypothetical protein
MLEVDPETKLPYAFQKVYQHVFTAMYLLSTILNTPPPPVDLLLFGRENVSAESVDLASEITESVEESKSENQP